MTGNETEATSWEASIAKNIMTTPRASFPYPDQHSTLEQLEPDMDDDIIDITDYLERPVNDRRSPQHKQKYLTPTVLHTSEQSYLYVYESSSSHTY